MRLLQYPISITISEVYDIIQARIFERIENFQGEESSWIFKEKRYLDISTGKYEPMFGSSFVELPEILAKKRAIINVQNEDECFKWAGASAIYQRDQHPERLNSEMRNNAEKLNWKGISFPSTWKDISKFESHIPLV